MFAEQILRMVAGVLVGIWVARYLGPEQFGVFSYVIAFASLFSSIAKLGLDGIVVRDLVKDPEQRNQYLGTAFWLKLLGALLMLCVIAIILQLTAMNHLTSLYILIIASGSIFQAFEVVDFYFQSKVLSKFVSISKLIQLFISSLLKLYFIYTGAELIYFVIVTLIDQVTLSLSLYIAYRLQKLGGFYRYFSITFAKQLFKDSWPLIFSGLAVMFYMRIDQIMIKEILGEREVGIYSAAVKLSEVCYFIPVIVTASVFPSIANSKKVNEELYYSRLQYLYTFMVWLAIAIAIPMSLLSDWLVNLLYGPAYHEGGQVLMINIWAGVFVFLGVASSKWLLIENMQINSFYRTMMGLIVNVVGNIYLIPIYGVKGAAISALISQATAAYFFDLLRVDTRKSFYLKSVAIFPFISYFHRRSPS